MRFPPGESAPFPWRGGEPLAVFLSAVADAAAGLGLDPGAHGASGDTDPRDLAAWLGRNELAPAAYALARRTDPELANHLRREALGGAASTTARLAALAEMEARFADARIPVVVLKGAALANWAYADPSLRPMTDLDLWVRHDDMERSATILESVGYREDRPRPGRSPEWETLSGGERVFRRVGRTGDVVELHYSPFQGWWTARVAAPDAGEAWSRAVPIGPGRHARRLEAEDAVLQIVVHAVVNRFRQWPFRSLLDVAVIARRHRLDRGGLVRRIEAWKLRSAAWIVLEAADRIFGVPGMGEALVRLRPSPFRVLAIRTLLSAGSPWFLVALSDDPGKSLRLVGRTLWPERWWLDARYGNGAGRSLHFRELLRGGGK